MHWLEAGYPGETKPNYATKVESSSFPVSTCFSHRSISTQDVMQLLREDKRPQLVDVRSLQEYYGWTSGYNYLFAKGRLPDAIWGGNGDCWNISPTSICDYENPNTGYIRSIEQIRELWNLTGVDLSHRRVIFYCGNGYRSSLAFFYASLMGGCSDFYNYLDGWSAWSTNFSEDLRGTIFTNNPIQFDLAPATFVENLEQMGICQQARPSYCLL